MTGVCVLREFIYNWSLCIKGITGLYMIRLEPVYEGSSYLVGLCV